MSKMINYKQVCSLSLNKFEEHTVNFGIVIGEYSKESTHTHLGLRKNGISAFHDDL